MEPNQVNAGAPVPSVESQSMDAFYRDLPDLLKKHYRKWVAYHGDELIGVGRTQMELHQMCLRRGLKVDEFVVMFADHMALSDLEEINIPDF